MIRTFLITVLLCALSVLPGPLLAPSFSEQAGDDTVLTDAESIKVFGDSLFQRGLLFKASMEYERFLYLHPSHSGASGVLFNLATAAQQAGDHHTAVTYYTRFLSLYPEHERAGEARRTLGETEKANHNRK